VDDRARARRIGAAQGSIFGVDLDLPDPRDAPIDRSRSGDPALLVYTSGTTGRPKGAPLTHGNLLAGATAVNLAWRWQPDDRLLLTLPLFHVHGLGVGINGSLCAGAAIVLRPRFEIDDVVARSADGISLFFGVPAMYQRLAASGRGGALAPLRLLVSGSAPLPAALAAAVAEQAGQIPLERYGMTETLMLTSNPYDGPRKPGTVGVPLPAVGLRLTESGDVEVRGPSVIARYDENADPEAFTGDGWFRTGDLGELDDDGYLRLVGRSKDLIITGGYNVHPREVEEVLEAHSDVREAAVVGRRSERWGEEVTAVVVAERPVPAEALRAHAAGRLAPYKVPKRIEFAAALPRNALGKVLRGELRDPG
jgi:malonyl-CoA/methylmalonyl-CoA synthetase